MHTMKMSVEATSLPQLEQQREQDNLRSGRMRLDDIIPRLEHSYRGHKTKVLLSHSLSINDL